MKGSIRVWTVYIPVKYSCFPFSCPAFIVAFSCLSTFYTWSFTLDEFFSGSLVFKEDIGILPLIPHFSVFPHSSPEPVMEFSTFCTITSQACLEAFAHAGSSTRDILFYLLTSLYLWLTLVHVLREAFPGHDTLCSKQDQPWVVILSRLCLS